MVFFSLHINGSFFLLRIIFITFIQSTRMHYFIIEDESCDQSCRYLSVCSCVCPNNLFDSTTFAFIHFRIRSNAMPKFFVCVWKCSSFLYNLNEMQWQQQKRDRHAQASRSKKELTPALCHCDGHKEKVSEREMESIRTGEYTRQINNHKKEQV